MIRVLGEDDAVLLRALRLRALRDDPDSFLSSLEVEEAEPEQATRDRLRQVATCRDAGVLGAFDAGTLIRMLGIARERLPKASSHRVILWGMYVTTEARGRGAGRALVDAAVARLRAAGIEGASSATGAGPLCAEPLTWGELIGHP